MNIDQLDPRRKKLYYRSCHRGIKEMDIVFSRFAAQVLPELSVAELDEYERLLALPDTDLFSWVNGQAAVPPEQHSPLLARMLAIGRD